MSCVAKKIFVPVCVAFVIAFVSGVITTWPLARHAGEGISALHRAEHGSLRISIPGDHLQLMYFFQLMRDFVAGETPWFHNLYEFNEGDDAARYRVDFYYVPFSLVFSAVDLLTGNAALAWNVAGFVSLWLGTLGVFLLVRRFTSHCWVVVAATVAGTVLPYRLITFLHGSPTGFGIAYVPFMLLGLDYAIRAKKVAGGLLAGLVFFLAEWADLHVYFFLALVTPFWCVFVYLYEGFSFDRKRIRKIFVALLPLLFFVFAAGVRVLLIREVLKGSVMADGRTVTEVAQFSPSPDSYWSLNPDHPSSYVYLTFLIPLMIVTGFAHAILGVRRDFSRERLLHFLLLCGLLVGIGCILLLGLGPRMPLPRSDRLWELFVRVVRPYRMIRQPAKVQVLLPSLLAVCIALPFSSVYLKKATVRSNWIFGVLALLLLGEVAWRIDPAISVLDQEQKAYAAVVADAKANGEVPRAVAVVLWPGDSHWSSLNQYYAMKYRIRMLNGYSPIVSATYFDDVFLRFFSLNRGYASDAQLDELLAMGIRHILIHEDAFPERVSPFGVAQTLKGFLENPRVQFLHQDRAVWAFAILDRADEAPHTSIAWNTASVTFSWPATWLVAENVSILGDSHDGYDGPFLRLSKPEAYIEIPDWGIHYVESLRLSARVRGQGLLALQMHIDGEFYEQEYAVDADTWQWVDLPYPAFESFQTNLQGRLRVLQGGLDVDHLYVAQGEVPADMSVGDVFRIPSPTLFRAGYTDLSENAVIFRPELVPSAYVLYGPRLPLPVGDYVFRLIYESEVEGSIGEIGFRDPGRHDNPETVVVMGADGVVEMRYKQVANLPVTIEFFYNRSGTVLIRDLEIERLE